MVVLSDKTITEVARSLDVSPQALGKWVARYRADNLGPERAATPAEAARIKVLEDENRSLKMENEFLKKASQPASRTR